MVWARECRYMFVNVDHPGWYSPEKNCFCWQYPILISYLKWYNISTKYQGDVALGGSELREGEGHFNDNWKPRGFDTKQIFVSPSIKYAGCAVYSKKTRWF